jgi:hypothetical protein
MRYERQFNPEILQRGSDPSDQVLPDISLSFARPILQVSTHLFQLCAPGVRYAQFFLRIVADRLAGASLQSVFQGRIRSGASRQNHNSR